MPNAPRRPCRQRDCPELTDDGWCADHRPAAFVGSSRRETLPPNWERLRRIVLRRAGYKCELVVRGVRCNQPANQVDHVIAEHLGGSHDPANLQALCRKHHAEKSAREANAARRAKEQQ